MKIEVFIPKCYIGDTSELVPLDEAVIENCISGLVEKFLTYEMGVTQSAAMGYYKSTRGIFKSEYTVLTVYMNDEASGLISYITSGEFMQFFSNMHQESIGVVIDDVFHSITSEKGELL